MKKTIILFATATIICATTQAQSYWSMSGNSASGTNFIGTTNNTPFRIRTNNVLRMSIDENRTGLGLSNPSANLHIHSTYIEDPGNIIEPAPIQQPSSTIMLFEIDSPALLSEVPIS